MGEIEKEREAGGIRERLTVLAAEQAALEARLAALTTTGTVAIPTAQPQPAAAGSTSSIQLADAPVTSASSATEKIALFRSLFAGRHDVFPVRWENAKTEKAGYAPACKKEWVPGVCRKPQIKCGECPNQAFIPVSNAVIASHLQGEDRVRRRRGDFVAGVYPLLENETCWFLVADFDEKYWVQDVLAYVQTCRARNIPVALERSRSGKGGHAWIFFSAAVSAREARRLGTFLISETMERRPEISFDSYDRFFPSQDAMPSGGFGNLIALPLQRKAREIGNSVFIDDDLRPYEDQWAYLSSLPRLLPSALAQIIDEAELRGSILDIKMPLDDENAMEPWRRLPSRRFELTPITDPLPDSVKIVLADELYVDRSALPPSMVARLRRIAAFQNPEFYRAQAMRLSTYKKHRIISCAVLHADHVSLPRGLLDETVELLRSHGVTSNIEDLRVSGTPISAEFLGTLREEQNTALRALEAHDFGVLAATTAFGKTVVAAALIAKRACNTLVLVHRKELLTQWVEQLKTFLAVEASDIGVIGGGKRKPTGHIDVALIQSLVRKGDVYDLVADYGQILIDECHHISASSFELVARRCKARYVLGLSATVTRKDGHDPIIFMQCGPVRYRVDPKSQAALRGFEHRVHVRETQFRLPSHLFSSVNGQAGARLPMPQIYAALAQDDARNTLIVDDVLSALEAGRSPIVLTERRDHLEKLYEMFKGATKNIAVLRGGMGAKERKAAQEILSSPDTEERLVLATGKYLGEGFDDSRLDTLFLTTPISWKGTLAQYVGRLHREHQSKSEVIVYDYVDANVSVLAHMASKRQTGYRSLGYVINGAAVTEKEKKPKGWSKTIMRKKRDAFRKELSR